MNNPALAVTNDGKGVGPTSPYCSVPPTDLTLLTKQNRGTFPEKKVMQILRYGTENPQTRSSRDRV
jgi:hypothetical protein